LPPITIVAVCGALIVAGMTKGLIGIGMPIVAVPMLSALLDLPVVVALLSIPLVIGNIPQAVSGERLSIVLKSLTPILLGLTVGTLIGVYLLTSINPAALKPAVGGALILVVGVMLFLPRFRVPANVRPVTSPAAGLIGGVLGGLAALPGPLVFVYLLALGINREQFIQYSSAFLTVAATLLAIALGGMGALSWTDALISTLCVLPIFAGMWFGTKIRQFVSVELFRRLILGVVMVSGIHLVLQGHAGPGASNNRADTSRPGAYSEVGAAFQSDARGVTRWYERVLQTGATGADQRLKRPSAH
jgi:uncharacterized membrane protein YfcA